MAYLYCCTDSIYFNYRFILDYKFTIPYLFCHPGVQYSIRTWLHTGSWKGWHAISSCFPHSSSFMFVQNDVESQMTSRCSLNNIFKVILRVLFSTPLVITHGIGQPCPLTYESMVIWTPMMLTPTPHPGKKQSLSFDHSTHSYHLISKEFWSKINHWKIIFLMTI